MSQLRAAIGRLLGLVVDDGFLAIGALVAIALTGLLAADRALGEVDATGWVLVAMLAGVTTTSVLRAVRSASRSTDLE